MHYDYLIVGAGLFGAVFAHEMKKQGKTCYVIDKREHIAGNIYTEDRLDIAVHKYGAHIFHTSDKAIWDYVNQFAEFNHYVNSPVAVYKDELYNLPFNMNTFSKLWNIRTPQEAKGKIAEQIAELKATIKTTMEAPEAEREEIQAKMMAELQQIGLNQSGDENAYQEKAFRFLLTFMDGMKSLADGDVWFMIHESYGRYNIGLYYENLHNQAHGEDL